MKKSVALTLIIVVIISYIAITPAFGKVNIPIPGLIGFTSMTDSISMGSFSSGLGSSSNLEFSTDTLIVTGGTPRPTPIPTPIGPTGTGVSPMAVPPQWIKTNQPGVYFDPITSTSWVYDPVFMTYFSPQAEWFLIIKMNENGQIEGFFYYDIKGKQLFNSITGEAVNTGSQGQISGGGITPTVQPTQIPTVVPTQPVIVAGTQGQQTGTTGQATSGSIISGENACLVPCQSCPAGYCHDCNNNGICDEDEGSISEQPQDSIQRNLTPPDTTGGMSEEPQEPIQINLPVDIPSDEVSGEGMEGGQSEEPQSSVLYMLVKGKGPFRVIQCSESDSCVYCIDEDDNGICSDSDCYLIACGEGSDCSYCLDCDRNGQCDLDKLIITNCIEGELCETFDYCDDPDMDGTCNFEGTESLPTIDIPELELLQSELLEPMVLEKI